MRQILSGLFDCRRCGLANVPGATHCAACGQGLKDDSSSDAPEVRQVQPTVSPSPAPVIAAPPSAAAPASSPAINSTQSTTRTLSEFFGWRSLDGTIVGVGTVQMGRIKREWWEILLRIVIIAGLIVVFGSAMLVVLIAFSIVSMLLSALWDRSGRSNRPSFLETMFTQLASYLLLSRLLGPRAMLPVSDYRLRDSSGKESLVRVEGYVQQGAMAVGDDVSLQGFAHDGTLILRRGWNRRLGCAIRVKRG